MNTDNCIRARSDGMTEEQLAHERKVRERILDVVHDLRHDGKAVTKESILQEDGAQRGRFEQRRWYYERWEHPHLAKETAAIEQILPTLMELTGCLTADPRIKGWLALDDFEVRGGVHCSFAGIDADRVVWRFRACGKPALYIATEGVIHYLGMTPINRDRISWIGVCSEHLEHTNAWHHMAAFHRQDHNDDGDKPA